MLLTKKQKKERKKSPENNIPSPYRGRGKKLIIDFYNVQSTDYGLVPLCHVLVPTTSLLLLLRVFVWMQFPFNC